MNPAGVEFSLQGGVALIRLAKPSDHTNALGMSLLQELSDAIEKVRDDGEVKLILLIGKGRTFSSGADLSEIRGFTDEEVLAFLRRGQSLMRLIMNLDMVTIAGINGLALGGGLELALACDIRWAHARAVFGLPEAKLGLIPGWGGISLLRRLVPGSFSAEFIAGGDFVSARRAYGAGLVSRLFEGRDFEDRALAEAKKIAERGAGVLRRIKELMKAERGSMDFSAGDRAFLALWNERGRGASD